MAQSKFLYTVCLTLLVVMVITTGCSAPKPVTSNDMPVYPNATPPAQRTLYLNFVIDLAKGPLSGYEPEMNADGEVTGHRQYVVNTTLAAIEDFYKTELETNGWKRMNDFPEKDYECLAWKRGNQVFLVCSDFNKSIIKGYHTYLFNRK